MKFQVPPITGECLAELYSDIAGSTDDDRNRMQAQRASDFFMTDGYFKSHDHYNQLMNDLFLPCAQYYREIGPFLHAAVMMQLCVLDDFMKRQNE